MKRTLFVFALLVPFMPKAESIFPLKSSEHRRHFVTQQGKPFFYHAGTGSQILSQLVTEEATA